MGLKLESALISSGVTPRLIYDSGRFPEGKAVQGAPQSNIHRF